ncbi:hypothetical protein MNV49_003135 [Pseudohyphozyma bogoriensis]|nr:hypothetical protein MNV49_003135 [Pseudohyphozyma bogoriensis]
MPSQTPNFQIYPYALNTPYPIGVDKFDYFPSQLDPNNPYGQLGIGYCRQGWRSEVHVVSEEEGSELGKDTMSEVDFGVIAQDYGSSLAGSSMDSLVEIHGPVDFAFLADSFEVLSEAVETRFAELDDDGSSTSTISFEDGWLGGSRWCKGTAAVDWRRETAIELRVSGRDCCDGQSGKQLRRSV